MSKKKNELIGFMDDLPWIAKIILCIPALDILWGIYRIVKGVTTNNTLLLIIGILWIFPGTAVGWIVDLICMIVNKKLILA